MLTSRQNPLIKQIRKLRSPKERHQQNLFLLEGTHLLEGACAVNCPLGTVCATLQWQQHYPQLWQEAEKRAERAEIVSPEVLNAIATTVTPDGVVATVPRDRAGQSPSLPMDLGLVLDRLQDPGNLGTIIRTAVATQVEGLWLSCDSVDLDHPKVLRASAGEWFRLPMVGRAHLPQVLEDCRQEGMQIVATVPQAKLTYWDLDFRKPTLILLGNEGAGLSPDLLAIADRQVAIPVKAEVESLNVAIAAALLLYEVRRQRDGVTSGFGIPSSGFGVWDYSWL